LYFIFLNVLDSKAIHQGWIINGRVSAGLQKALKPFKVGFIIRGGL